MKRRDLDNPTHPYRLAPRDVWLGVGSPTSRPYPCRVVPLSRGYFALVDPEDYAKVVHFRWTPAVRRNTIYAVNAGKTYMHTLLTGFSQTDHINGVGLDNRRINLREATNAQNQWNRPKVRGLARYKGIKYHAHSGLWHARIRVNNKVISLRYHKTQEEAALVYDKAARELHGEFAVLNFPQPGERSALTGEVAA